MYEQNFSSMSREFRKRVQKYLGDGPDSPDWEDIHEISVAIEIVNQHFKVLILQYSDSWVIGNIDI